MPTFSKFLNGFRGCQQVLDSDGYIYSSKKYDNTVLSSAWRCQKNKSLKCPAMCYLALTDNTLSLGSKPHNHDSDLATPQRLELLTIAQSPLFKNIFVLLRSNRLLQTIIWIGLLLERLLPKRRGFPAVFCTTFVPSTRHTQQRLSTCSLLRNTLVIILSNLLYSEVLYY